jgi:alpha-tubulin suppressor-like RCC1 family protein
MTMETSNYEIFTKISPEFFKKIESFCIFGDNGENAFFRLKNDQVWAFGMNDSGKLGFGNNEKIVEPKHNEYLSQEKLGEFAFGEEHVIALNREGKVFGWGSNSFGQVGMGNVSISFMKPTKIEELISENIVQIKCNLFTSIALSKKGFVYTWGYNGNGGIGNGDFKDHSKPIRVSKLEKERIISISSGCHHSLALTCEGYVYVWGSNELGQLGNGKYRRSSVPSKVVLFNTNSKSSILIEQIQCGAYHNLLLSKSNNIFSFGYNQFGQLGNGSYDNSYKVVKIPSKDEFLSIAAESSSNLSVAKSKKGKYFVWGKCFDFPINRPKECELDSIEKIFAINLKKTFNQKIGEDSKEKCVSEPGVLNTKDSHNESKSISLENDSDSNENIDGEEVTRMKQRLDNKRFSNDSGISSQTSD